MVQQDELVDRLGVVIVAAEELEDDCTVVKPLDKSGNHEGCDEQSPLISVVQWEGKSLQIAELLKPDDAVVVVVVVVVVESVVLVDKGAQGLMRSHEILNLVFFHFQNLLDQCCKN